MLINFVKKSFLTCTLKSPTYKGVVLFSPRAVEEILLGTILYHASGSSVMDGKSIWNQSIGKKVVSPLISISDHPHDPRFTGATAFDGDGSPNMKPLPIGNGVQNAVHRLHSAKTGASPLRTSGLFALVVEPGKTDLKEMQNARNELLIVDRFSETSTH